MAVQLPWRSMARVFAFTLAMKVPADVPFHPFALFGLPLRRTSSRSVWSLAKVLFQPPPFEFWTECQLFVKLMVPAQPPSHESQSLTGIKSFLDI